MTLRSVIWVSHWFRFGFVIFNKLYIVTGVYHLCFCHTCDQVFFQRKKTLEWATKMKKKRYLRSGRIDTAIWMHYMDSKKTDGEEARRQLHKNAARKSWRQHPTRHQLYGHEPPITKTIQVRRTRHAVHCWRSRDELISDVLLWTPTHGRAKAGRPVRTYI